MVEKISIEGNTLSLELGELEARIVSRATVLFRPLLSMYIYVLSQMVLAMASLGKDKAMELYQRMEEGGSVPNICEAAGLNLTAVADKLRNIEWPAEEEVDQAFGWLEEDSV